MKKYLFPIIYLLLLSQVQCTEQDHIAGNQPDPVSFKLSLRQYKIDTCLADLLYSIVESDSSHLRYPPDLYCYMLQFAEAKSYKTITITPARWIKHLPRDCSGLIEVRNMSFLCCGSFKTSPLFIDIGVDLVRNIFTKESSKYDSLDAKSKLLDWKNSPTALVGSYKLCQDTPIDLYINVGRKLEGFGIKQ